MNKIEKRIRVLELKIENIRRDMNIDKHERIAIAKAALKAWNRKIGNE